MKKDAEKTKTTKPKAPKSPKAALPKGAVPEDEINVRLSDVQIDKLLQKPEISQKDPRAKVVVFSVGIISFDVSARDLISKKIKVTVLLMGIPVGTVTLSEGSLEQTIGPNIGIAKASITLTVSWSERKVRFTAKACVRKIFSWKCANYSGTLFSW
jgi:hypothetical protein